MGELQDIPDGPLRRGYTTGACATACAKAALTSLVTKQKVKETEIQLPIGETAMFQVNQIRLTKDEACYATIKDAGDDPDVTHGAEIIVTVVLNTFGKIIFERGEGVGLVTLPGLEIPVGEPAINPVPRKMMSTVCKKILSDNQIETYGVTIKVAVTNGEQLAKRTLNSRLGILYGISILGTSGIVTPFSAASYIASIQQGVDVAIANKKTELLINSGARSEKMLRAIFPVIDDIACVHYGNWIQEIFEKIHDSPQITKVSMGIMLGKAAKLAQGKTNTHSGKTTWDKDFIYQLTLEAGYPEEIANKVLSLNMAGRLREIFTFAAEENFYQKLIARCHYYCQKIAPNVQLHLYLINNDGAYIEYTV
ncbi:cobalt-precorrin-5B (C(1))-methyltransferase [Aquimarina sp. 2201CG5-10]|uniref:cobalt-precorrin-5B (C(1))-methyltransferase n=1 Tax=Aquimarina callyspongiae TaxID=3098150 RepID=UPI002AB4AB80|nr:cobalt-precorrin-5B (C(1))-methyltransferase [Aquimarina sp. 2201CG5-10]MDY8136628.1 cobalt-precorrin-5B (C(1))-methyltransferase [Aquimarina sp. 2201CG5-10]